MKKKILILGLITCILAVGCGKEDHVDTKSQEITVENADETIVESEQTENQEVEVEADESIEASDEGNVSLESNKVKFDAIDAAGNPIKLSLYSEGETYTLKIEETTWEYLAVGDEFPGMKKL